MTSESPRLPLTDLRVIDLSTTVPGAQATQFLADYGADVVHVEPPGGSSLRDLRGYPYLARGKRSVVLDLHADDDRQALLALLRDADCLVATWRPGVAERLGLDYESLAATNPRLISAAVTGYGSSGPWRGLKGYEGLIMAKLGLFHNSRNISARPGPAYVSVPYASWGASMAAVQGILAAVLERDRSGLGQYIETNMVQGLAAMDCWNWFIRMIGARYPGAFRPVELFDDKLDPAGHFVFPLLVAPTADGRWLQFAQTQSHLFLAFLKALGLAQVLADPYWKGAPVFDDKERRIELWELMLSRVRAKTLAEWENIFDVDPNVYAEQFRAGPDVLRHPQVVHDGRVLTTDDAKLGKVTQPSLLVHPEGIVWPGPGPAPALDSDGDRLRGAAAAPETAASHSGDLPGSGSGDLPASGLPLAGIKILELGVMFAGPHGATVLTDLGARVFKVESKDGDAIRNVLEFPEVGGSRVMQGKESIALDLDTPDGLRIVRELARHADVVLMAYRAGAAERAGVDVASLRAVNPNLVYLSAPGYGTGGPCGHRPAYAPSIGAAGGMSLANAPGAVADTQQMDIDEVKQAAARLASATAGPNVTADGISALGVASAIMLGLVGRSRGIDMPPLTVTMLSTVSHAMFNAVVDYDGALGGSGVDPEAYGLSALYRLYEAADGWMFLAAPQPKEWEALVAALRPYAPDLAVDPRFATAGSRGEHDRELADILAGVFRARAARSWESELTAADVGCAVAETTAGEDLLMSEEVGKVGGYVAEAWSPLWDEHPRLAPLVRFSRSIVQAPGGCTLGQHTDALLQEIGYDEAAIKDLRDRGVVA